MRRLLATSIVLAVAVAGCGDDTSFSTTTTIPETTPSTVDVDSFERFDSPELGFSIAHPEGWSVTPSLGEGLVEFSAPLVSGGLTPNFNVATGRVADDVPAHVYYQGERSKLEANLPDVQVVEEADVTIDGVPARGITIITDQAGVDVGISRLIVLDDGQAWEITFFAEASRLEEMSPLVVAIFQSFRFLDG